MKESLISHQTTVHENKKPFKCGICQKSFGANTTLKIHQRTVHENEKPFKCGICQKSFVGKSDLWFEQAPKNCSWKWKAVQLRHLLKSFGGKG